jgi:hypothetical protein
LQGVRGVRLENCHLFNADVATLYAFNAVGLTVENGGLYQGLARYAGWSSPAAAPRARTTPARC